MCRYFWESSGIVRKPLKRNDQLPVLSADLINDDDDLEAVLESFLKKQMKELDGSFGERVSLELLAAMISERFTKLQVSEADLVERPGT